MDSKPLNDKSLNAKSLLLSILSLLSILFILFTLKASWNNPQEQTKLDLLQTDLILQATQVQDKTPNNSSDDIFQVLVGDGKPQDIYAQSLRSYQEVLNTSKANLTSLDRIALDPETASYDPQVLSKLKQKKQTSISEISIRAGLLQTETGDIQGAIATWGSVAELEGQSMTSYGLTAQILKGLWSEPIMLFPNAETQIRRTLNGWYRQAALTKLYQAQQRPEQLPELEKQAQIEVNAAIQRLLIVNSIPLIGGGVGIFVWVGLLIQWIFFRKSSPFHNRDQDEPDNNQIKNQIKWQVPWGIEITWEVMVLWFTAFCLMTQLILPLLFEFLGIQARASEDFTIQALLVLIPYVLSVISMLPILQTSLAAYHPLPEGWFRFKIATPQWLVWGVGGYFAAVPLVLIVSVLSQKFLQGQGGGNPLLPILTESQNNLPKFLLWTTLAIAAPFFEEYLFRGFLLPSLTKFLPVWGAIALSGFFFALAHLNIADIIPLTILGMVMGFVYWRSKNLLSSMLLHCLWNSGSFLALIALGGK